MTFSSWPRTASLVRRVHPAAVSFCLFVLPLANRIASSQVMLRPGHVPQAAAESRLLGPVPRTQRLDIAIGLPLRNREELDALLADLSDPRSPRYRQYLTPQQFAVEFGPTEEDYQAVIHFAESNHLTVVHTYPNRLVLSVSGAVADVEAAFQTRIQTFSNPTRGTFFAPDTEPSVPYGVPALDVAGLDNLTPPEPLDLRTATFTVAPMANLTGSGPGGYFIGGDFRAAYAPNVALTGSGQSIALLEFDGFFSGDVTKNFAAAKLPAVPVSTVLLDGISGSAGSSNTEVILDIMMAAYMAPGATKILVYEGKVGNDILNRMATDDTAAQLSSSWSFGGVNATTESIFQQFAAQGQTMFQAAGDSGAYAHAIPTPADDPAVTVVGGTSLTTSGPGGPWQSETAWSGSGGGVSTTYPIPAWQAGLNMTARGGSITMRNIPDVALTGDIQLYLICDNGKAIAVGGTSAATPLWAGFLALANQQAVANGKPLVGFLNPTLYTIGGSGNYGTDLHDITTGSNGAFHALAGYDLTTGWGSPAGQPLIDALTSSSTPGFFLTPSSATLTAHDSSTASATVTVGDRDGFTGTVLLSVSGLPVGVTAAFSPASTSTASTLTLAIGPTVAAGTYNLSVTGVSGSITASVPLSLVVVPGSFTLAASPSSLILSRYSTASTTIAIAGQNGFSGTVALTASGLPAGVTAAFTPASATSTSSLVFTASSTAIPGTTTVTIKGVSGSLAATTTVRLTVQVPSFTLTPSPSALIIVSPNSAATNIVLEESGGFSGSVALTVTGLPTGVTALFSPASVTAGTPSQLRLTASSGTAAGNYLITVTGTSGTLSASTKITLTIEVPSFILGVSVAPSILVPSSGTTVITASSVYGFTAPIALTATGLPAGVTASFSPASILPGASSTLTFATTSAAVPGAYTVTVTGTSGTTVAVTRFLLTLKVPGFSLIDSNALLTVHRLGSASATIYVAAANGFAGAVSFTAGSLPTGVTAQFSPATASAGSPTTLTLTASNSAPVGTYDIVVYGISGAASASTLVVLRVTTPALTRPSDSIPLLHSPVSGAQWHFTGENATTF